MQKPGREKRNKVGRRRIPGWLCALVTGGALFSSAAEHGVTGVDIRLFHTTEHLKVIPGQRRGDRVLPTIAEALKQAEALLQEGKGVTVALAPGVYREGDLAVRAHNWEGRGKIAPLVITGMGKPGQVVVTGADEWLDGWKPVQGHPGVFRHDWPYQWGMAPNQWWDRFGFSLSPLTCRREAVWVNGRLMRQVLLETYTWSDPDDNLRKSPGRDDDQPGEWTYAGFTGLQALEPGTFGVVEREGNPVGLYLRPGPGYQPGRTKVEVSVRRELLRIAGKDNVALRNLTFEKAAGGVAGKKGVAVFVHGDHVLVDQCRFNWNGSRGLSLGNERSHITVRGCQFNFNGWRGLGASRPNNMLLTDCVASYNNWRGNWGDNHGWDAAAIKIMGPGPDRGVRVERLVAVGNRTHGLWFDHAETERAPIEVVDSVFAGNQHESQLYIEKQPGPVVIRRNVLWGNTPRGTLLSVAHNVTLEDNLLVQENPSGFLVKLERRTNGVRNDSANWTVQRNLMLTDGSRARIYARAGATKEEHRLFVATLKADANHYSNVQRDRTFENAASAYVNFEQWKKDTGQDANSTFGPVKFAGRNQGDWRIADPVLRTRFEKKWPVPPRAWLVDGSWRR